MSAVPGRRWHQSSLAVMLKCGEQYRRRYIEKDAPPPTTSLIRGSAVHRAVALGLEAQRVDHEPRPRDFYEDVAATEINNARRGSATFTHDESAAGIAATWGRVTDVAVACAGAYGETVAPDVVPVSVERTIAVDDVPGLPGVTLVGTLDVATIETETTEGGLVLVERIRDDKTTERSPRSTQADASQQLTMYSLLRSVEAGQLVSRVALDHLVYSAKTKTARHVHQPSTRTSEDLRALIRRIAVADRAHTAGIFLPASPEDWWCSERWCAFWSDCPFAQRRQPPPPSP